jgi:hypothetical protein
MRNPMPYSTLNGGMARTAKPGDILKLFSGLNDCTDLQEVSPSSRKRWRSSGMRLQTNSANPPAS